MKYKNILAYPLPTIPLYFKFLEELHNRNYFEHVNFILLNEEELEKYQNDNSLPTYFSFELIYPEKIRGIAKSTELVRLEEQYGVPTLNLFELLGHRSKVKTQKPEDNLRFWENYLEKNDVDMIIMPFAAMINTLALVQVAKKQNIQVIYAHSIRAFGRATLTNANLDGAIFDVWQELNEKYKYYLENSLNDAQVNIQEEKIKVIKEEKPRPIWFKDPPRKINKKRIGSFIKILNSPKLLKKKFLLEYNYNYLKFGVEELPKEEFFMFPMHYEPEVTLDLLAPYFRDQLTLIKYIAQSLPVNHKLIVKEHPGMKGRRNPSFYKEIEEIKNTILLDLNYDSYNVLDAKNCKGLIVINSTTGFEAVLLEKPVISFGKTFYAIPGVTTPLTDLTQLPDYLMKMEQLKPKRKNILSFLQALDDCTFKGFIYPPSEIVTWVLEKKNVTVIANEFEKKFPSN